MPPKRVRSLSTEGKQPEPKRQKKEPEPKAKEPEPEPSSSEAEVQPVKDIEPIEEVEELWLPEVGIFPISVIADTLRIAFCLSS